MQGSKKLLVDNKDAIYILVKFVNPKNLKANFTCLLPKDNVKDRSQLTRPRHSRLYCSSHPRRIFGTSPMTTQSPRVHYSARVFIRRKPEQASEAILRGLDEFTKKTIPTCTRSVHPWGREAPPFHPSKLIGGDF